MRKLLVGVCGVILMASVGCQTDSGGSGSMSTSRARVDTQSNTAQTASADVCTHCPGKQMATAQGTCPSCGMKVSTTNP